MYVYIYVFTVDTKIEWTPIPFFSGRKVHLAALTSCSSVFTVRDSCDLYWCGYIGQNSVNTVTVVDTRGSLFAGQRVVALAGGTHHYCAVTEV